VLRAFIFACAQPARIQRAHRDMRKPRKFLVTLEQDEDGWFVAKCPSLPGCVSQGKTREEAIANIREAIEGSLETRAANSIPSNIETIEIEILVA
jgi:predicted RNase H-like HicB family nuclease